MWLIVRFSIIGLSVFQGGLSSEVTAPSEGVSPALLATVFGLSAIGMLLVIGIQRINPRSSREWRYPSWSINPFLLREPLQFFHLSGFYLIAVGVGSALRLLALGQSPQLSVLFFPACGAGVLAGVHLCTLAYRGKMVCAQPINPQDAAR